MKVQHYVTLTAHTCLMKSLISCHFGTCNCNLIFHVSLTTCSSRGHANWQTSLSF